MNDLRESPYKYQEGLEKFFPTEDESYTLSRVDHSNAIQKFESLIELSSSSLNWSDEIYLITKHFYDFNNSDDLSEQIRSYIDINTKHKVNLSYCFEGELKPHNSIYGFIIEGSITDILKNINRQISSLLDEKSKNCCIFCKRLSRENQGKYINQLILTN